MSSNQVLHDVSKHLQKLLEDAKPHRPAAISANVNDPSIELSPPSTASGTAGTNTLSLSVWLYQVVEDEFVKNQPMRQAVGSGQNVKMRFPPLALNLSYLVTPFAEKVETEQLMLGWAMQVFYDQANTRMNNPQSNEDIRISLCRSSLEEHTRIWDALNEPYRLSVAYEVRVVTVDSRREQGRSYVVEQHSGFGGNETVNRLAGAAE
jgi:hypothetical protein